MKNRIRLKIYSIIVIILIGLSIFYRASLFNSTKEDEVLKKSGGRKVIQVAFKKSYYSDYVRKSVEEFNRNSKDIYIDFKSYGDDYLNLLRLNMLTLKKPDIFQFGFYDFLRNEELYTLDELGIEVDKNIEDKLFYYKGDAIGVKISGETVKLLLNRGMLKNAGLDPVRAPGTWQDLIDYSFKIKDAFPNVIPFEFPFEKFGDVRVSVGENSLNNGSIYTSFWNYKEGKYDFLPSKDILLIYKDMYSKGLISKDFSIKTRDMVLDDFINKKTAIIISTYNDKKSLIDTKEIGVYPLPIIKGQPSSYYYTEDINTLVASKNNDNKDEIKRVYRWLLDSAIKDNLFKILKYKTSNYALNDYDNNLDFKYEKYDPTGSFGYDYKLVRELFCGVIDGTVDVFDAINKLNNDALESMEKVLKEEDDYFKYYIDKE